MSGNIQPGSKMELVKGLHTATNSQTEEGLKRRGEKRTCLVTQASIEMRDKDSFVQRSQRGSSVTSVYRVDASFITDDDF